MWADGGTEGGPSERSRLASQRQAVLLGLLVCPICRREIELLDVTRAHGSVIDASIRCAACSVVGTIRDGRPSFHARDVADATLVGLATESVDLAAAERTGRWIDLEIGTLGDGVGARLSGTAVGNGVILELGTHPWSGRAMARCGEFIEVVDLYSEKSGSRRVVFDGLPQRNWAWSVEVTFGRSPKSLGNQAIVRDVAALVPASQASPRLFAPVNRGNPYPAQFDDLVRAQRSGGVILDVGGGDRVHHDPRVLNFEYLPFKGPDFFGDGLHIPVRDGAVDLVLSQAVLEHVTDPVAAVSELRRVLRPGGMLYVEIAFMQPLHAVPFHYFNVTPHGRDLLFQDFEILDAGSFGGLAVTVEWFFRLVKAGDRIGSDTATGVLAALARLDESLTPSELDLFASGVWVKARKP